MARKTVEISYLRTMINDILALHMGNGVEDRRYREGMIAVLEAALHETGNYRGFVYLTSEQVPALNAPGIQYLDGMMHPDYQKRFENTDPTRIRFLD